MCQKRGKMKIWKKVIAGLVAVSLLTGAGAAGLHQVKKSRMKEVIVIPVEDLASDYYTEDTTLDGTITTNVSQKITMDKDMVVENLYVSKGDEVKKGDLLITFDMTLVEMELNIAKLKQEKRYQDLAKAKRRLSNLQNGGSIEENDSDLDADHLSWTEDEDLASAIVPDSSIQMAFAVRPFLLAEAFFDENNGDEEAYGNPEAGDSASSLMTADSSEETGEGDGTEDSGNTQEQGNTEESGNTETPGNPEAPDGTDGTDSYENTDDPNDVSPAEGSESGPQDGEMDDFALGSADFSFAQEHFYQVLDDSSIAYSGKGKKKKPYLFLCSSANDKVRVMGSFLNKMAGFSADGTQVLHPGGYWYLLEFHEDDKIENPLSRKDSCTGYYLINGGLLTEPVSMFSEIEYSLDDALMYKKKKEKEELPDYDTDTDDDSSVSREEAIRSQQNRIRALELDIEEGEINIRKLEKKMESQEIVSRLDGTVISVGDPLTGASDSNGTFLTVKSKEGFYVKGSIGELMLDQIEIGSRLKCTSYSVGDFEAEVMDVSDYPSDSNDSYFYGGDSNPNVSYYSFSASIEDQSLEFYDGDWIQITLQADAAQSGKLVISKAYVRSENGMNYVYKDENGVLKKTYIQVGKTVDGGYSVMIRKGLSKKDKIAFPYGDDVKDGALTKEGTEDDLYETF